MAEKQMWREYELTMTFVTRLFASVPANAEVIAAWLESRGLTDLQAETEEAVSAESEAEKTRLVFKHDESGLYIEPYALKAHAKDSARVLMKWLDVKALKSKVADRLYVTTDRLYLLRNGGVMTEPDGYWEHPVQVQTMKGPRSALKAPDYAEPPCEIQARLKVLNDGLVTESILRAMLDYGREHGFGGERGMGYGRYTYEVKEV